VHQAQLLVSRTIIRKPEFRSFHSTGRQPCRSHLKNISEILQNGLQQKASNRQAKQSESPVPFDPAAQLPHYTPVFLVFIRQEIPRSSFSSPENPELRVPDFPTKHHMSSKSEIPKDDELVKSRSPNSRRAIPEE